MQNLGKTLTGESRTKIGEPIVLVPAHALCDLTPPISRGGDCKKTSRLAWIDFARGIAALAVALFHFACNGWLSNEHFVTKCSWFGHLGVKTFFVISGFVVPLSMWRSNYQWGAFPSYFARRMVRLYPPYVASVLIAAGLAASNGTPIHAGSFFAHFLYLNDLLGLPWLLQIYWTLGIEVQFYLLMGLIAPWLLAKRSGPFALAALISMAACCSPGPGQSFAHQSIYFLLGIAALRIHERIGEKWFNAAVVLIAAMLIDRIDGVAAAIAALLPLTLFGLPAVTPRWGQYLGKVSYSFYLFHLSSGMLLLSCLESFVTSPVLRILCLPVALSVSFVAAMFAYRYLETPALRWAGRYRPRPADHGTRSGPLTSLSKY